MSTSRLEARESRVKTYKSSFDPAKIVLRQIQVVSKLAKVTLGYMRVISKRSQVNLKQMRVISKPAKVALR